MLSMAKHVANTHPTTIIPLQQPRVSLAMPQLGECGVEWMRLTVVGMSLPDDGARRVQSGED